MRILKLAAVCLLLMASPALAGDWKVEAVSGDAVSVMPNAEPDPLDADTVVKDGATIITGPATSVRMSRNGDSVQMESDTIAALRQSGGRALVEPKAGRITVKSVEGEATAFQVVTRFFRVDAQAAQFSLDVHKDFATVSVAKGEVLVQDLVHGGDPTKVRADGEFRGEPLKSKEAEKAKEPEKPKAAEAPKPNEADAALKELDKLNNKGKLSKEEKKKRSALVKKLAEKGLTATKEGLEEMAEDYDGDNVVETPKMGILSFLFGANSPGVGYVLGAAVVLFLGFGGLADSALGAAAFGKIGNAVILLIGALLGAAIHDFVFTPEAFWDYEPTPGIVTPTVIAAATLVGACFLRKYLEDRWEASAAAAKRSTRTAGPKPSLREPRRKFG